MTVAIAEVHAVPYALAFNSPVVTARGRFTHRRGWLLRVLDTDGRVGWGDAAPWPGFGATDEHVSLDIGAITDGRLEGMALAGLLEIASDVARRKLSSEASHALELALLDLLAQRRQLPLAALLGGDARLVETHSLVTDEPDATARWLKVKVGGNKLAALETRLAHVIARAHGEARVRVDVGGGWTLKEATTAIARLARYRVHTIEQPLPAGRLDDLVTLRAVAGAHGIALAVDEDVTGQQALDALLRAEAVDEVVVKPMFVGGLLAARRLVARALAAGCRATITNALESAVGRAGARHLAAGVAGVHGLSDALAEDVATLPARAGDAVALPPGHGLGVRPHAPAARRATISIPNPLQSSAIARPAHAAVVTTAATWTYAELARRAAGGAKVLRGRGVTAGTRVGLLGNADAHWLGWLHAVAWLGAVAVPLPNRVPADELDRIRTATGAATVVDTTQPPPESSVHDERFWPLEEARAVVCSSGTNGTPHPVELSTLQLMTSAFASAIRLGHSLDDRWLCCLPLHHVGGLSILYRAAHYGTTVVLHERFDATRVAGALDDGDATLVSLVPEMLARVLDARLERFGEEQPFPATLRAILLGGAATSAALVKRCAAIDAPVALTWGMTEAASQVATSSVGDTRLVPNAFCRVDDRDGRLWVRGPIVATGELTTGDAGTISADGAVQVLGRADDVIVSGGEKVAPAEIEHVLRRHPAIDDAAVVSRACPDWGQRPFAAVQTREALTEDTLARWCRQHLAPFKVPDGFICLPLLPRAELGKVALAEVRSLIDAQFSQRRALPHKKGTQP